MAHVLFFRLVYRQKTVVGQGQGVLLDCPSVSTKYMNFRGAEAGRKGREGRGDDCRRRKLTSLCVCNGNTAEMACAQKRQILPSMIGFSLAAHICVSS